MGQWGLIEIPFGAGINTKIDSKNVQVPNLIELENAVFTELGTLKKRKGYKSLTTGHGNLDTSRSTIILSTGIDDSVAVATRGNELVMWDANFIYSKAQIDNGSSSDDGYWVRKDKLISCIPSYETFLNRQDSQYQPDYAEDEDTNSAILAWLEGSPGSTSAYISFIDTKTGSVLRTEELSTTGQKVKCRRLTDGTNTYLVCFYVEGASAPLTIKSVAYNVDDFQSEISRGWISATTLFTDLANPYFDVHAQLRSGGWMTYVQNTTGDLISQELLEGGTKTGSTASVTTAWTTTPSLEVYVPRTMTRNWGGSYKHVVTWLDNNGISAIVYQDGTGTIFTAATNLHAALAGGDVLASVSGIFTGDDAFSVYYTNHLNGTGSHGEPDYQVEHLSVVASTLGTTDNGKVLARCFIDSHPFEYNGEVFLPVAVSDTAELQGSTFLYNHALDLVDAANATDERMILMARYLASVRHRGAKTPIHQLQEWTETTSGKLKSAGTTATRLNARDPNNEASASSVFTEPNAVVVTLDFESPDRYQWAQLGDSIYFTGGMLWKYDGDLLEESGFAGYPEAEEHTVNSAGSESYAYRLYFEKIDGNGETDQSTFAGELTIDSVLMTGKIDFEIQGLNHTRRMWDGKFATLAVFRTEDAPGPDALFHRITGLDPNTGTGDNRWVELDPQVSSVSLVDAFSDSTLTSKDYDYQSTGELENISPPSPSILGVAKNRLWLAGGEIPKSVVLFSKEKRDGRPVQFNDRLFMKVDTDGGKITAIASLNQNVIIFKERKIYVVTGAGPNAIGQGFFAPPQEIATDVGCINQKTVVEIPDGLMFQSKKGIYILGNDLSVTYIGANVEAYNDQTFARATVVPEENHVVFLSTDGSTLLYDYIAGAWCTWTNHLGLDSVIWQDQYTYVQLASEYILVRESGTEAELHYDDDGTQYAKKVVTPWIHLDTKQGHMRAREFMLLGNWKSNHTFRVTVEYDYDTTSSTTMDVSAGVSDSQFHDVYQIRVPLPRQKFQSVRLTITEQVGTPDQGYELQKLQLKVMKKKSHFAIAGDKSGGVI